MYVRGTIPNFLHFLMSKIGAPHGPSAFDHTWNNSSGSGDIWPEIIA